MAILHLSTSREQLIWLGASEDETTQYLDVLNIVLPAVSVPGAFLIIYINNKLQATRVSGDIEGVNKQGYDLVGYRYLVMGLLCAIWSITANIKVLPVQYFTFVIYCFWRSYVFATLYATLGNCFSTLGSFAIHCHAITHAPH